MPVLLLAEVNGICNVFLECLSFLKRSNNGLCVSKSCTGLISCAGALLFFQLGKFTLPVGLVRN